MLVGYNLVLDRFVEPSFWLPMADVAQDQINNCAAAIVIFSPNYEKSHYCNIELEQLLQREIPIYILSLTPLRTLPDSYFDYHMVDFSAWRDETFYQTAFHDLREQLAQPALPITEEKRYLLRLLSDVETHMMTTHTARLCAKLDAEQAHRLRCYSPDTWLYQGNYHIVAATDTIDGSDQSHIIPIEDVAEWLNLRRQLFIAGQCDTGKTTLLMVIAQYLVHRRLNNRNNPLPLVAQLSDWDINISIEQFLSQLWQLDGDLQTYIQRGNVMLLLDSNIALKDDDPRLRALRQWLTSDDTPSAIITTPWNSPLTDNNIVTTLVIDTLSQTQVQTIQESTVPSLELSMPLDEAITIEELAFRMVDAVINDVDDESSRTDVLSRMVANLWTLAQQHGTKQHTLETITERLIDLATRTHDMGVVSQFPRALALESLEDDVVLQQLIALGILEQAGRRIRFVSAAMQTTYALMGLLERGIYTSITYPAFDEQGYWVGTAWDRTILSLHTVADDIFLGDALDTIAGVDPYLALQLAMTCERDTRDVSSFIWRIASTTNAAMWSHHALAYILEQQHTDVVQQALHHTLHRNLDVVSASRLYPIIAHVHRADIEFQNLLLETDFEFRDIFYESVADYTDEDTTLSVLSLTHADNTQMAVAAIHALAFLPNNLSRYRYEQLLQIPDDDIHQATLDSLYYVDSRLRYKVMFSAALHAPMEIYPILLDDIIDMGRRMSMRLVQLLDMGGHASDSVIEMIAALDEYTVMRVFANQFERTVYDNQTILLTDEELTGMVRQLFDTLGKHMENLADLPAFEAFVADVLPTLRRQEQTPQEDIARLKTRLQRISLRQPQAASPIPEDLHDQLTHSDWVLRRNAVQDLGQYPVEHSIPLLLQALYDDDYGVQIAAIQTLPDPKAHADVCAALLEIIETSPDYHVVDAATQRLSSVGHDIEATLLDKLADTNQPRIIAAILTLLASATSDDAVEALTHYIQDGRQAWLGERQLSEIAMESLAAIDTPFAIETYESIQPTRVDKASDTAPPLSATDGESETPETATQEFAFDDFDHDNGEAASEAEENDAYLADFILDYGADPIHPLHAMIDEIRGNDWGQAQTAAKQLRQYTANIAHRHTQSDIDVLLSAIDDPNWTVRWAVIEGLAWFKNPATAQAIVMHLEDENWVVRAAAIRTLIELKAVEVIPALALSLNDEQSAVREAAAEAIGELGGDQHARYLQTATTDEDDFVRFAVVKALIKMGGAEAGKILLTLRHDPYLHIRWHIAQFLTDLKHERLIKTYTAMLRDNTQPSWEDKSISNLAENALKAIDHDDARSVLAKWQQVKHRYQNK